MSKFLEKIVGRGVQQQAHLLLTMLMRKHYPAVEFTAGESTADLLDQIDHLTATLIRPDARSHLIDIQKTGGKVLLTFKRGDDTYVMETYGSMSANLAEMRRQAGLE